MASTADQEHMAGSGGCSRVKRTAGQQAARHASPTARPPNRLLSPSGKQAGGRRVPRDPVALASPPAARPVSITLRLSADALAVTVMRALEAVCPHRPSDVTPSTGFLATVGVVFDADTKT